MSILDISVSGLLAAQRGLQITSHNITNVNTPGYNRQVLEVNTREPMFAGNGFIGSGVQVVDIKRVHDEFLVNQIRTSVSGEAHANAFLELASRVDNIFANSETGLAPSLENFFNAVQGVSNTPSSITARQVMLSEADALVSRLNFLESRISDLTAESRSKLSGSVNEINSLAQGIATVNNQIVKALGQANGQLPNDLLDQRDQLLVDLSKHVSVTTSVQDDGAMNVFIGNGQAIVLSGTANRLDVTESFAGNFDITFTDSFTTSNVTDSISGGALSGVLSFQSEMLSPSRNALGRIGIGLAETFNAQHRLGQDLNGNTNVDFFNNPTAEVIPISGSINNIAANPVNASELTNSDYRLIYTGTDTYTLTRLIDGQNTVINTGGSYPFTTAVIDGFTLDISSAAGAIGDEYIVQPTINGASDLSLAINNPRAIAAAGQLRSRVATNAEGVPVNTGAASITAVSNDSTSGIPLVGAITLTFNAALNQFDISAPPGGSFAYDPNLEASGKGFTIPVAGNASFTISGIPDDGDQFVIENNSNADGDNSNMLLLSDFQNSKTLINGTASYQDAYGKLISDVGTRTRQTEINSEALGALVQQSVEARESKSGVNLDEEAANMLEYQQIYMAATQLISTSNTIFQSLLNSVR